MTTECDHTIGIYWFYGGTSLICVSCIKSGYHDIDEVDPFDYCPFCGKKIKEIDIEKVKKEKEKNE